MLLYYRVSFKKKSNNNNNSSSNNNPTEKGNCQINGL